MNSKLYRNIVEVVAEVVGFGRNRKILVGRLLVRLHAICVEKVELKNTNMKQKLLDVLAIQLD